MPVRTWTTKELREAAALWKRGHSLTEMAETLGRGRESVKHATAAHRDLFPYRRQPRADLKDTVTIKMTVSDYTYKAVKKEAKDRGISINMLIRETFLHRFVRKTWKLPESTSTAKVKFMNGSPG